MEKQYEKPKVEWEELFLPCLLCDSTTDGSLEDLIDEPII